MITSSTCRRGRAWPYRLFASWPGRLDGWFSNPQTASRHQKGSWKKRAPSHCRHHLGATVPRTISKTELPPQELKTDCILTRLQNKPRTLTVVYTKYRTSYRPTSVAPQKPTHDAAIPLEELTSSVDRRHTVHLGRHSRRCRAAPFLYFSLY